MQNVALNKPASQSSEEWTDQNTGMAVDGNPDSNYTHADHSCSHTDSNDPSITHAWWMVDLGKNYLIENITIQNRGDCCGKYAFVYIILNYQISLGISVRL